VTRTLSMLALTCAGLTLPAIAQAQDTLHVAQLQEAALRSDPRAEQSRLLRSAGNLRVAVIGSERLPQLTINGWASHQSDLTQPSAFNPNAGFPVLPLDRWQSTLDAEQVLYDGGDISRRREVERARNAESEAQVFLGVLAAAAVRRVCGSRDRPRCAACRSARPGGGRNGPRARGSGG
jgi:hypothetical protein